MVENRPGHEDAQPREDDRHRTASETTPDPDRTQGEDADIGPQAASPTEPEPHTTAPHDPTAEPESLAEAPAERSETRFADEPLRASSSEPNRPGIAAMMLPPILAVAIAAAVVVGAAKTGLLPQFLSSTSVSAPAENDAAIEALKARIAELEARPAASRPVADATALDALSARIASLEARPSPDASAAPAVADPALTGKVESLERTVATLRDDIAALRSRTDQLAGTVKDLKAGASEPASTSGEPPADKTAAGEAGASDAAALAAINARLAELEQAAKAPAAAPTQAPAAASDDTPLRRLVTATMLDLTVKQGTPYAAVLKAAQPLAADPATLKPLEPFADTGVPSAAALGRELIALLPKLLSTDDAGANPNFIDRFQANAERLVRIQRSDATAGPDRTAIIGRLTAAAQRGDLAEARRELKALAPADRAPVQSWIDKSEARDQALAASQSFATAALAALSKPSP